MSKDRQKTVLEACRDKIDLLVSAIEKTKKIVEENPDSRITPERVKCYLEATEMQQELLVDLKGAVEKDQATEIMTIVNKINGLSSFIRNDAIMLLKENSIDKEDLQ